ncbi:hypothetical protein D3C85_1251220 [compost metagenome]
MRQAEAGHRQRRGHQRGSHVGAVLQVRHDDGDEGQRQEEIERPVLRHLRADQHAGQRGELPARPQREAGAEVEPVAVARPFAGIGQAARHGGEGFIGQQVGHQRLPAARQRRQRGGDGGRIERVAQVDHRHGKGDDQRRRAGGPELGQDHLGGAAEHDGAHRAGQPGGHAGIDRQHAIDQAERHHAEQHRRQRAHAGPPFPATGDRRGAGRCRISGGGAQNVNPAGRSVPSRASSSRTSLRSSV